MSRTTTARGGEEVNDKELLMSFNPLFLLVEIAERRNPWTKASTKELIHNLSSALTSTRNMNSSL